MSEHLDDISDDDLDDLLYALAVDRPVMMAFGTGEALTALERERLVRPAEAHAMLGISKATLYRLVTAGSLPRPIKISVRVSGWPLKNLLAWRDRQPGGPEQGGRKPKAGRLQNVG